MTLGACSTPIYQGMQPTMQTRSPPPHLTEATRASIESVAIVPHTQQAEQLLFGSYNKPTVTIADGARGGAFVSMVVVEGIMQSEVGRLIPVSALIPELMLPGALIGGIIGFTAEEIQKARDALTDALIDSASKPLANMAFANDAFSTLRHVQSLDVTVIAPTTLLPKKADAVLLVRLVEILVHVEDESAEVTTYVEATLRRASSGTVLWHQIYAYKDKDRLGDWAQSDAALWRNYINFARHYIARRIAEDLFERNELRHDLHPIPNGTVKRVANDNWRVKSKNLSPTLSWTLDLKGSGSSGSWAASVSENDTLYDLEIYDRQRLVYSARQLPEAHHEISEPLDACKAYWWTVRPSYIVGGRVRQGEWMRFYTRLDLQDGRIGDNASQLPAFLGGFAELKTRC